MKRFISILLVAMLICCSCKVLPETNQTVTPNAPANESSNIKNHNNGEQTSQIKKDSGITNEMREFFFDLVAEYRIDAMRDFSENEIPNINDMKWYVAHLHIEEVKNANGSLPIELFSKEVKEKFGFEYDTNELTNLPLSIGSLNDFPFAELIQYSEQNTNEGTLITATVAIHRIWPLVDHNVQDYYPAEYKKERTAIIEGSNNNTEEINNIIEFSYISEDGKTPEKFISSKRYTNSDEDFLAFFE